MKKKIITACLLASILLSGCSMGTGTSDSSTASTSINSEAPVTQSSAQDSAPAFEAIGYDINANYDSEEFDKLYRKFVFDYFKESVKSGEDKKITVSPFSIMMVLDLVAPGAGGETLNQILSLYAKADDPAGGFKYASDFMKRINESEDVKFKVANSTWFQNNPGKGPSESYKEYIKNLFDSEINVVDFAGDSSLVGKINDWVNTNTDGMIPDIIDTLDADTVAVLINAVAFDGKWETAFDREMKDVFHGVSGDVDTTYLAGGADMYYENDKTVGFMKAYQGGKYGFAVIMPADKDADFGKFVDEFTPEDYEKFYNGLKPEDVSVSMPAFKAEFSNNPIEILSDLGMTDAFVPDKADFKQIYSDGCYISQMKHKTFIDVNKEGTEAAAASSVVMTRNAVPVSKFIDVNRPYIYAIVELETGNPIFIGSFKDAE